MDSYLEQAEQTALDAANAIIKLLDFSSSVLEELSKAVADVSGLKFAQYNIARLNMQDARVIRRYTKSRSLGEVRVHRYIYTLYSMPSEKTYSTRDLYPFLLISLLNKEERPPEVVYGTIQKIAGEEKSDKDFIEYFLLWLNEQLGQIYGLGEKKEYGWEVTQEISGRADANKIKAKVSFQVTKLLDITSDELLSERASTIAKWFIDRLGL
jgi:hypothetical protein